VGLVSGLGVNEMTFIRRIAIVASLVLCGLIAFSATTVAFDLRSAQSIPIVGKGPGPGPSFLPAGNYDKTTVNASLQVFGPTSQMSVNVSATTNAANPLVGPTTLTTEVDVSFNACDFTTPICGGGCFIPDGASDFTFASNLSSATLNTTVKPTTASCQNNPVFGFTPPFTLNVVWVGGASTSGSDIGRYACSGYSSETRTIGAIGTNTIATANLSAVTGTFGPVQAFVSSFDQRIHVQGAVVDSCPQLGGKGAGPGPQAPGNYGFVTRSAFASATPNDGSAPLNIFVTSFTNTFNPSGEAATTQVETDLNISQFNFFTFIENCYVIPASALTLSGTAAAVHVAINSSTPVCQGHQNSGLPDSFTVDATWSATSPIATFSTTSTSGCGSAQSNTTAANAIATGGITGLADSFADPQASIGSNDVSLHIVKPSPCL